MNRVQPRFWRGIKARAAVAPDGFVSRAHIEHLHILDIAQPEHFPNILSQFAKTMLAQPQSLFRSSLLSDVTRNGRCPANFSFAVLDGRDRQRNRYPPGVFAKMCNLEMFDGFAVLDSRQNLSDPIVVLRRRQSHDRAACDLRGRVTVDPLGGSIPGADHSVQGHTDDGVVRRFDDCGQLGALPLCLEALGDIDTRAAHHCDRAARIKDRKFAHERMANFTRAQIGLNDLQRCAGGNDRFVVGAVGLGDLRRP